MVEGGAQIATSLKCENVRRREKEPRFRLICQHKYFA